MSGFRFTDATYEQRVMDMLRVAVRTDPLVRLGYFSASQMEISKILHDDMIQFATNLLADNLGEEKAIANSRQTEEFVGFATWWDHFKATYRGRWWMSWRKWRINYKIDELTVLGQIEVDLKRYWAYPKAEITPPEFGEPVRWTITNLPQTRWDKTTEKRFSAEER